MAKLFCLFSCLLAGASAWPSGGWEKDEGKGMMEGGKDGGEMEGMSMEKMEKMKMILQLEEAIRQKTKQQMDAEHLKDVHEDFVKYLKARHHMEMAKKMMKAMEGKEEFMKMAFIHFMKMMSMKKAQIGGDNMQMGGDNMQMGGDNMQMAFMQFMKMMSMKKAQMGGDNMQMGGDNMQMGGAMDGMDDDKSMMGGDMKEMDGPGPVKLMSMWKLFVEFETAFLQQNNIMHMGLDEKTKRGLFFETFGRFVKNSMMIKEHAKMAEKLHNFVEKSKQKGTEDKKEKEMKEMVMAFVKHMMAQKEGDM